MSKLHIEQVDRVEAAETLTLGELEHKGCFVFISDNGSLESEPAQKINEYRYRYYSDMDCQCEIICGVRLRPVRRITAKLTWSYEDTP